MFSYWSIKNYLELVEENLNNEFKALNYLLKLKKDLISYLEDVVKILEWIEKRKIPKELYSLVLQNIQEIALDLDHLFSEGKTYKNGQEVIIESKISKICTILNRDNVKIFFEKFSEVTSDMMLFLEHYTNKSIPSPKLSDIKKAVETIKKEEMYTAQGRFCSLEELTTENDKELFELMKNNKDEYRFLISDEPVPETYEEFQERLKIWFTHGRNYQFLVKKDNKTVGTIFFYGLNYEKKSVKLSAYFIPEVRKTPLIGEALGLILNFALEILKVEKVEFSVYKENKEMLRILEKEKNKTIY